MLRDRPVSAVALIDAPPVLLLPSALALKQAAAGQSVRLDLLAPRQFAAATQRLAEVLRAREIDARLPAAAGGTLEQQLASSCVDWGAPGRPDHRVLDVSAATGGTAVRAVAALAQASVSDYDIGRFSEEAGCVRFLSQGRQTIVDCPVDIGSNAPSAAVTPAEFLSVLGLEERREKPYGDVAPADLLTPAQRLLSIYADAPRWDGPFGQFRRLLRPHGAKARPREPFRSIPLASWPAGMLPMLEVLEQVPGWTQTIGDAVHLTGPDDAAAVFFLSGGWLEILVAEAIRRALPDRHVHMNLGTTWGEKRRTEAETDVTFVYDNCLYLLSCKNEAAQERLFSHLDRFRALVAEFGESRTRPVLLSTAPLEPSHLERCMTFEIGVICGSALLTLLGDSLGGQPVALFEQVLHASRRSPRAGLA